MTKNEITVDDLKKYFDPFIFDNLNNPAKTEIQSRQITIVFWDISGFSKACNELIKGQEAIIAFLKEYFSLASEIIARHAGVLDKFIGDGIMAYFGYPIENENHPMAAIAAALELKEKFEEVRERYQIRWNRFYGKKITINVKCGIHSGFAFCGLIEAGNRNQITVIGDDVNLASRLEGIAKDNQILISEDLRNMVENTFDFEEVYLKPEERMKAYENMDRVFLVLTRREGLAPEVSIKKPYRILTMEELKVFPFYKAKYELSQKYHELLRIEDIVVNKLGTYYYELIIRLTGSISKGFIDLLVKDISNEEDWFPDYKSFDGANYVGRLEMNNQTYTDHLLIDTSKILRDDWNLFVLVFEDSEKYTSGARNLVCGAEVKISPHDKNPQH
jgi:class 3 adenylate cyclase